MSERQKRVLQAIKPGLSLTEVANLTGETLVFVHKVIKKNGIELARLYKESTPEIESFIKENHQKSFLDRKTNEEIAFKFDISVSLVKTIKRKLNLRYTENELRKHNTESLTEAASAIGFKIAEFPSPIRADKFVKVICFCGKKFETLVDSLARHTVNSCGCLVSKPQQEIHDFIQGLGLEAKYNDYSILGNLELDIFIPEKRIAIEYCGLRFHGELLNPDIGKHKHKFDACLKKGIRLITIFENEWLERPNVVKAYITSIFNKTANRIGGRDCKIVRVSKSEAIKFLDEHHIQGACLGTYIGLYTNELVAVMALKKENKELVISRYCVKTGLSIAGGFTKLLKVVDTTLPIVTFSDNRWSLGNLYQRTGFIKDKAIKPNYYYFKVNTKKLIYKSIFRKEKIPLQLGPLVDNETEWEAMKRFGYDRIWDCGKIKWILQR